MSICLDFSAIKSGGGLQLASSFLQGLDFGSLDVAAMVVADGVSLEKIAQRRQSGPVVLKCPRAVSQRLVYERIVLQRRFVDLDVTGLFTFFGAGLPHGEHIRSSVTVAYPIVCYPDSAYWRYISIKHGVQQRVMNFGRIERLRRYADVILAETPVMAERLRCVRALRGKDIRVVPPAPSLLVPFAAEPKPLPQGRARVLFLAGLGSHKNLWRLPEIAGAMRRTLGDSFCFAVSTSREAFVKHCSQMGKTIDAQAIEENFEFLGTITPEAVVDAVDSSHFVANLSDLESFTNNYMEAWARGRPLIVSDRDFARYLVKGYATYVEPHEPEEAAELIANAINCFAEKRGEAIVGRSILNKVTLSFDARLRGITESLN